MSHCCVLQTSNAFLSFTHSVCLLSLSSLSLSLPPYLPPHLSVNPGFYSSNWLYIGKCYLNLGKKEEAKEWLRKAVDYRSDVMMGDDLEVKITREQLGEYIG